MTHGYMLSGSGSNVYVQNLCRAFAKAGHEVHLLCQEPTPLDYDFVGEHYTVNENGAFLLGDKETPYAGRCAIYTPEIGDLLPVYVYDEYPGWRVATFLDLEAGEFERYVRQNVTALRSVLSLENFEAVITNHSVPGPFIARKALVETKIPFLSIVHGSALQYVARKSEFYREVAREGLEDASRVLALSEDSAGTILEDFPELENKVQALPGGVDTDLFRPGAVDLDSLLETKGGAGRGPEQSVALEELLRSEPADANSMAEGFKRISATYNPRSPDRDLGGLLGGFLASDAPLIIYVGKLIHSKGVHSLLSAFARLYRQTGARLLVVGFGTFREALEALTLCMSNGDLDVLGLLKENGRLYEGGPSVPMEHFSVTEDVVQSAAGMADAVEFVGPLEHRELAKLWPTADVAVVPSIFPESFGLVAAEAAASGVPPFVADHSGLREVGSIVGRGLPFDLRVGMNGFDVNLSRALTNYLGLSAEEKAECRDIVRRNTVENLGWDTLAGEIARGVENG